MEVSRSDEVDHRLVSRAVQVPSSPSRAALREATRPRLLWDAPDESTVVAGGVAAELTVEGDDRFDTIRTLAESLFESGDVHAGTEAACPRLFGGFAFHADGCTRDPWLAFPPARFVLPRVQVTYTDDRGTWVTVNAVGPDATPESVERRLETERERLNDLTDDGALACNPGIESRRRTTSKRTWNASVSAVLERIAAGDLNKVVLAQALSATLSSPPSLPDVLEQLDAKYPDCYRFLFEPRDDDPSAFFGATPELLVSRRGRTVNTDALAGTTGRGDTPAEDEWLSEELLTDPKNGHEHDLVAETIRDQLAPFTASVQVGQRRVKRLANVQHLYSPISATLSSDAHIVELVEALHPTPAVGGLPPDAALDTIRETEPFDRGWYAAPVGWFDAAGNGTFAVALRSAVAVDDEATLFAGVGIVADSDPDREWDEVQLKYRPILDELEDPNR